jgi:energy-converting hydrogenase Eha subunit A
VGHKLQFRKELTEWQKKRRVFFALAAVAPLSIIALCLTAFYFRDVACVIVYWAMLVLIILVTLAVAGRQYIHEVVNGKPVEQPVEGLAVDLEGRWWDSLSPQEQPVLKADKKKQANFVTLLARSFPDLYFARSVTDFDLLLLGPSGIWVFKVENWSGTIVKQQGTWKEIQTLSRAPSGKQDYPAGTGITRRDKLGHKRREENIHEPGPDDQWLQQKQGIVKTLEKQLPERAWTVSLIQGGVVFSHPKVNLDKKGIQGNTASYGRPKAWAERIHLAPLVDGFTLEMQLEILDAMAEAGDQQTASAKDEAERLYQQAVAELRAYVAKMVK